MVNDKKSKPNSIRWDLELLRELQKEAKDNGRTFSGYVHWMMEIHPHRKKKKK